MPVTATPKVDLHFLRMPSASAIATSRLTAPCSLIIRGGTSLSEVFRSFEYTMAPPRKYRELPLTELNRCPNNPPVQDSATATVDPRMSRKYPTICSSDSP